ncbi:MAG: mechanosensitive ion channel family protein [Alphaproteobacteria bacterium]|nr:mechanosensitive ion channel family protein [Alphaproteobacteria bacterium SS10]
MADTNTDQLTAEDLARLSDGELRTLFVDRLTEETANQGAAWTPADLAYQFQQAFTTVQTRLGDIFGSYGELGDALTAATTALTQGREDGGLMQFVLLFLLSVGIGWAAAHFASPRRRPPPAGANDAAVPLSRKLRVMALSLSRDGAEMVIFAVIATTVFMLLGGADPRDRVAFAFYLAAILIMRVVSGGMRAYLSLPAPAYRIPAFDDPSARRLNTTILFATALGAFGFFTCSLFGVLGVTGDAHYLFLTSVGLALAGGLAAAFVINRGALSEALLADDPRSYRGRIARSYPWLLATAAIVLWLAALVSGLLGFVPLFGAALFTVVLGLTLPPVDAVLGREVRGLEEPIPAAITRVVRLGLWVAAIFALTVAWRVNFLGAADDASVGALIMRALTEVAVVVLLAYATWESLRIWLDKKIADENEAFAAEQGDLAEMEIGGAGMSRLGTLLPLIKRTGQAIILVIVSMMILSSLGVDIGPVLAGAGVVGLAIGFGSQTLVRDIVSGAFFLIDDAFRQGEYIDLGSVKGSVEKINARSLQLRHHRGALNTVPFGEIATIQNYSRDWAIMKLRFRLAFDTDLEKVRKLLKRTGQELLDHPDVGEDFIQPFKSQGVIEVDDYGLVISTKFMCKPGKQFLIRRHAYAAVQAAFAENGIEFSTPEVRVAIEDEDEESRNQRAEKQAAGAAALKHQLRQEAAEQQGSTGGSGSSSGAG